MVSFASLEIPGHDGRPVANTFIRPNQTAHRLGILFPGYRYRATMPLLYYPGQLLVASGADVLRVETAYDQAPDFEMLSGPERQRWLLEDAEAACRAAVAQGDYDRITLVGKSIGTQIMGQLLEMPGPWQGATCVCLTPLLADAGLRRQITRHRPRSLFVIGTADPYYDPAHLAELQEATEGEVVVVEGADHSLEVAGDVMASLQAMERVMRALATFLD